MHRTLVVQSGVGVCASWDGEDEDEIMSSVADIESIQTAQDVTSWYVRSTERANAEGRTLSASRVPIGLVWTIRKPYHRCHAVHPRTGVMLHAACQVALSDRLAAATSAQATATIVTPALARNNPA